MVCPVPKGFVAGNYTILGNESRRAPCDVQGSGSDLRFDFAISECNISSVIDEVYGNVTYIATLVPNIQAGGVLFTDWPTVVCTCDVKVRASVQKTITGVVPTDRQAHVDGESGFTPVLKIYPNINFDIALAAGQAYPIDVGRFFMEVASGSIEDHLSVLNCTASPSASMDDEHAQVLWRDHCPVGPFDAHYHPHALTSQLHLSTRSFKFSGLAQVFLSCTILRCLAAPCGTCVSGRRMMSDSIGTTSASAGIWWQMLSDENVLILPALRSKVQTAGFVKENKKQEYSTCGGSRL